jgi:nitroreductase
MDFQQLIAKRYSVRSYKIDPVAKDKLEEVLNAARLAPTASNRQPFRLIVVETKGREEELKRIYREDWFWKAPVVICICAIPSQAWSRMDKKNYSDVDAAIAMDHLILAATELGLGTCWVAAFDPAAAREVLGLPKGLEPIAFTPLGYPADRPGGKKRKPLADLVRYGHW